MKKPVIAIIPDYQNGAEGQYSVQPHYALRCNYVEMLENAGAVVVILPFNHQAIDDYLAMIDGIMVVGGNFDLHPKFYQQEMHPAIKLNEVRQDFEWEFMNKALKTNMPILGICNGMQLINILHKGDVIQHIPDNPQFIDHEQGHHQDFKDYHKAYHQVNIDSNSKLFAITGKEKIHTNSSHHQAVGRLGEGLVACGFAIDGVVEALEKTNHPFCLAVQWHPEFVSSEVDKKIFASFVEASKLKHS